MKAKIDGFQCGDGVLIALVGFYYTEDENGYEKPERKFPKLWERKKQEPFVTLPFPFNYNTLLEGLKVSIRGQLKAFKSAHSKLSDYEHWLETEMEV